MTDGPTSPREPIASLICPLCRQSLVRQLQAWRCEQGHCYDIAREGYLNLLPVQHKKSREPGDNPQMVKARRDFLAANHYLPLRNAVVERLAPLKAHSLLDIGCGEGYYTSAFTEVATEVIGFDIAKVAIQIAARRYSNIQWLVASSALLPVADSSQDIVCSLFSPQPIAEMTRVLRPRGTALVVTPAPEHLWSLREQLFDTVRAHEPDKFLASFEPHYQLQAPVTLHVPLQLNPQDLSNLLLMTPYAWRATAEKRSAVAGLPGLETIAAFTLFSFQKR